MRHYESATVLTDYHCKLTKTSVTQDFFKLINISTWIHFTFAILHYCFTVIPTKQFTIILCCAKRSFTKALALVSQVQMCHILMKTRLVCLPKTGQRFVWAFAGCSLPSAYAFRWGGDKHVDTRQQKLIMHLNLLRSHSLQRKCSTVEKLMEWHRWDLLIQYWDQIPVWQWSKHLDQVSVTLGLKDGPSYSILCLCLHAHTTSFIAASL